MMRARSIATKVAGLLDGPVTEGIGLGHGYVRFGSYVVAITPPGTPRMPNGIECDLEIAPNESASIGEGALRAGRTACFGGPVWQPRPAVRVTLMASPRHPLDPIALLGRGRGLTPEGDDVTIGYVAGRFLLGRPGWPLPSVSMLRAAGRTTSLSRTLLIHAARGELPEPAHGLLQQGDVDPILGLGHSSGRAMLLGLALAFPGYMPESLGPERVVRLTGILDLPPITVRVFVGAELMFATDGSRPAARAAAIAPGGTGR